MAVISGYAMLYTIGPGSACRKIVAAEIIIIASGKKGTVTVAPCAVCWIDSWPCSSPFFNINILTIRNGDNARSPQPNGSHPSTFEAQPDVCPIHRLILLPAAPENLFPYFLFFLTQRWGVLAALRDFRKS
jgi:hypothetical protein